MWTKICGNTNLEDARLAVEFGADALGFIFAPGRRRVSPAQARRILQDLPATVEKVGVFTTGDAAHIAAVVREAGLTAAQLHLPLQGELVRELRAQLGEGVRLLQVVGFQVNPADPQAELRRFQSALGEAFAQPELFAVLVDALQGTASGGLGVPIDWHAAALTVRQIRGNEPPSREWTMPRIVLAGGLRAGNLRQAVEALQPWGVDVVSGVESGPGRKDPVKLRAFLAEARSLGDAVTYPRKVAQSAG